MVLLYTGINLQRSPLHALVADLLPSRYRSLGTASVTFQMCVGAIVFLMLGRALGMRVAFLVAAGTSLPSPRRLRWGLREDARRAGRDDADGVAHGHARAAARGTLPGLRAVFLATLLLQLTFQTFSTWFALHATERFAVRPEDVADRLHRLGDWRRHRRPAGRRARCPLRPAHGDADRVRPDVCVPACARSRATLAQAVPLLALASASWTLPTVNAFPLFMEPIPHQHRGMLAACFCCAWRSAGPSATR